MEFVASKFDTVEINRTFYSLVKPEVFDRWHDQVPDDFCFAVKGSRFITHQKKLSGVEEALANFLASGLTLLREKLGPILWQLPTHLPTDLGRVEQFLALLPADALEAVELARSNSLPPGRRAIDEAVPGQALLHALEVRHPKDLSTEMVALARAAGVCLAVSQSSRWPVIIEETAGFRYVRLHGPGKLYASRYDPGEMDRWARRVVDWAKPPPASAGQPVFVYFDNDERAYAPRQAAELERLVVAASTEAGPE